MSGEPDRFRMFSFDVITTLFDEELQWLRANRYKMIEHYPDFLDLLSKNQFSHWHMCQVKQQMDNEAKEKAKVEEEANRKVRVNPASLTSGYIRQ
jgi:hypothetical protein